MTKLRDVCHKAASNIAQKDLSGHDGIYPIYGASGFIQNVDFYQQEEPYIAVVKDGAGVGRVMKLPAKSSVIGTMQYIIPNDTVDIGYLAYAMEYMNLAKYYTGATIPHIYFKDYQNESLPLPSLEEQRRIAALLDKVTDLIAKRRAQLDKLDLLVKARFVEMFGDITTNPKGWKKEKLQSHINMITGFPFNSSGYSETGVKICGGLIIMPDTINWNECKFWPDSKGYEQFLLQENDIVIALDRPWISEGFKIGVIHKEDLPALLIQRTARIRSKDFAQQFLLYLLKDVAFEKHCTITGSLVPHISNKDINSYQVILPPPTLQLQFNNFANKANLLKQKIATNLKKLEILRQALMQQYFG